MKLNTLIVAMAASIAFSGLVLAADPKAPASEPTGDKEPLKLELPKPRFEGTPKNLPAGIKLEKRKPGTKREPFLVPKGVKNVAAGKPVTASDENPILGSLDQLTDGDKEAADGSFVEISSDPQWVQIDLKEAAEIYAIVFWHRHNDVRIYRDVIVQVSDDKDFKTGVTTLFNNDFDDSSKLGKGEDYEYIDTNEGKIVNGKGTKARYVRLYSNGSTADDQNHWTEVEVYALPAK